MNQEQVAPVKETVLEPEITLGEGVRLVPATEDVLSLIEQDLRPNDKKEHDFQGGSLRRPPNSPCWVILDGEDIIGAGGFVLPADGSVLSNVRVVWFLSTHAVNTRKKKFVRYSPKVLAAMCRALPRWVDTIAVAPMSFYDMSIKWLKRVMKLSAVCEKEHEGGMFTIMVAKRKDIENA